MVQEPPSRPAGRAPRPGATLAAASAIFCQSPLGGLRAQRGNLSCHREARGDLAFDRWPSRKERLLRRLICHRERSAAISLVIARSVAISVIQGWPSRKERLLRKLAATAMNVKRNPASRAHSCGAGHSRSSIIYACKRPKRHCSASQPRSDVDRNPVWLG